MSMNSEQEKNFRDILDVFSEQGALEHVLICGSWAEYLYEKTGMLKDFSYLGKTTDADFLIRNLRKPHVPINIVSGLKSKGFLYKEDYVTGVSKFFKEDFELEFLICQMGSGSEKLPRSNIGVNPQQMTHMSVLRDNVISVDFEGIMVNVSKPEAYVIQKMIINEDRKNKKLADQEKIRNLLPYLDIDVLNQTYESISKKEKGCVRKYIREYCNEIRFDKDHIERCNPLEESVNKVLKGESHKSLLHGMINAKQKNDEDQP